MYKRQVQSEADYGYFDETKGNQYVIGDIHRLREITMEKFPDADVYKRQSLDSSGYVMLRFLVRIICKRSDEESTW